MRSNTLVLAAAVILSLPVLALALAARDDAARLAAADRQGTRIAVQGEELAGLRARLATLEATQPPDWVAIAGRTEPSVFTLETAEGLGSAWVAAADASGSTLVTNYHVVASAWEKGVSRVTARQSDQSYRGTIVKVDRADDLAAVHLDAPFAALPVAAARPQLAATVMAIGSPLGLDGTAATGVISGSRSIGGADFLQFSAPVSPGNSGGPVVDGQGRVVGVSAEKLVGEGVESLAFAIPVQTVCGGFTACSGGS